MLSQLSSGAESFGTSFTGLTVDMGASEWKSILMLAQNMTLQGILLAKDLVAVGVARALVFIATFMGRLMDLESLPGSERLLASLKCAAVVTNIAVSALDMMFQVALAKVIFCARAVRTFERTCIGVTPNVLLKSCWPIECLVATIVGAFQALLSAERCARGGGRG